MEIKLSLSFFAALLHTDKKNLKFVIIKRKFDDNTYPAVRHIGIAVAGIKRYVFDVVEGVFVVPGKISDSTLSLEKAWYVKTDDAVILVDRDGRSVRYTLDDFRRKYTFRVVNSALY